MITSDSSPLLRSMPSCTNRRQSVGLTLSVTMNIHTYTWMQAGTSRPADARLEFSRPESPSMWSRPSMSRSLMDWHKRTYSEHRSEALITSPQWQLCELVREWLWVSIACLRFPEAEHVAQIHAQAQDVDQQVLRHHWCLGYCGVIRVHDVLDGWHQLDAPRQMPAIRQFIVELVCAVGAAAARLDPRVTQEGALAWGELEFGYREAERVGRTISERPGPHETRIDLLTHDLRLFQLLNDAAEDTDARCPVGVGAPDHAVTHHIDTIANKVILTRGSAVQRTRDPEGVVIGIAQRGGADVAARFQLEWVTCGRRVGVRPGPFQRNRVAGGRCHGKIQTVAGRGGGIDLEDATFQVRVGGWPVLDVGAPGRRRQQAETRFGHDHARFAAQSTGVELAVGDQVPVKGGGTQAADQDVETIAEELLLVGEQAQVNSRIGVLIDVLLLGEGTGEVLVDASAVVAEDGNPERAALDAEYFPEVEVRAHVELTHVGMAPVDATGWVVCVLVDQRATKIDTVVYQPPGERSARRRRRLGFGALCENGRCSNGSHESGTDGNAQNMAIHERNPPFTRSADIARYAFR